MHTTQNIGSSTCGTNPWTGIRSWISVVAMALLAGCGSIPDATINYHHAQTNVTVKVIRSVVCDKGDIPFVVTTTTPEVSHSAKRDKFESLDLAWFRGPFSDADVKVETFDDGRLKSVNATSTGQGEAVLKAATVLTPLFASLGEVKAQSGGQVIKGFPTECAFIRRQNKGDPITIIYSGPIKLKKLDDETPEKAQEIPPEKTSAIYARGVANAIGTICAIVDEKKGPAVVPVDTRGRGESGPFLKAVQPGRVTFSVKAELPNESGCMSKETLRSPTVLVADYGARYSIPIPRPAVFGRQTMGLAFAESGALTSIQYASTTGAAQALGGLASLLTIAQGDTTAQRLAAVKAEADLIAQQQRLVLCLAEAEKCPK